MNLKDKWSLDLKFVLVATSTATPAQVSNIEYNVTAAKTELTIGTDNGTGTAVVINGVNYYAIDGKTLGSEQLYVAESATLAANSHIFTIADGVHPIEVTNQVSIVPGT